MSPAFKSHPRRAQARRSPAQENQKPLKAVKIFTVLEMGLEPISLAAFDFESNVYTIPPLQHFERVARVYQKKQKL
jgi:hypothetical protein